jgi:hypothetical protein
MTLSITISETRHLQHYGTRNVMLNAGMLSVTNTPVSLTVVMLNVIVIECGGARLCTQFYPTEYFLFRVGRFVNKQAVISFL